jgi:hypothetical protein
LNGFLNKSLSGGVRHSGSLREIEGTWPVAGGLKREEAPAPYSQHTMRGHIDASSQGPRIKLHRIKVATHRWELRWHFLELCLLAKAATWVGTVPLSCPGDICRKKAVEEFQMFVVYTVALIPPSRGFNCILNAA